MTALDPLTLADALVTRTAVRVARLRRVSVGVHGALAGALLATAAAALGYWWFELRPPVFLLALPPSAALVALVVRRERVDPAEAAGTLDRVSGAEEAFLTATQEESGPVEWRRLVAETGIRRVGEGELGALLPFEAPRGLAPLLGALALLSALVLVPHMSEPAPVATSEAVRGSVAGGAGTGGTPDAAEAGTTPAERLAAAAAELRERGRTESAALVREDLPAVGDEELRELATALAEDDADAAAALAALDAGDRAEAIDRLRRALGAGDGSSGGGGNGTGAPSVPTGTEGDHARPPRDATWDLRYDRRVRDWFRYRDDPTRTRGAR